MADPQGNQRLCYDISRLNTFVNNLETALTELDRARQSLRRIGANSLGTKELDDACDAFQDVWEFGAERMQEQVKAVGAGVAASRDAYVAANQLIKASLTCIATPAGRAAPK